MEEKFSFSWIKFLGREVGIFWEAPPCLILGSAFWFCISNIDGRCFSIFGFGGTAAVCQTDCQCKVPEEENTLLGEGEEEGSKRSVDTGWKGATHILDDKRKIDHLFINWPTGKLDAVNYRARLEVRAQVV